MDLLSCELFVSISVCPSKYQVCFWNWKWWLQILCLSSGNLF